MASDDCGCRARQEWLNGQVPGLGDAVAEVAEPIKKEMDKMPEILRPDMKSLVWLAIGAVVVPLVLKKL
ncbi:hypothetical protein ACQPZP_14585 [Spirillospora sp. CA-142024]|uniref:hypothetical protein n=1 Tax=Spirillospora sp. CA-142024 TaxID=3240036 RepID=UPI003D93FBBE